MDAFSINSSSWRLPIPPYFRAGLISRSRPWFCNSFISTVRLCSNFHGRGLVTELIAILLLTKSGPLEQLCPAAKSKVCWNISMLLTLTSQYLKRQRNFTLLMISVRPLQCFGSIVAALPTITWWPWSRTAVPRFLLMPKLSIQLKHGLGILEFHMKCSGKKKFWSSNEGGNVWERSSKSSILLFGEMYAVYGVDSGLKDLFPGWISGSPSCVR